MNDTARAAVIAAVFGAVFVEVNAAVLPTGAAVVVRVAAAVVLVLVITRRIRSTRVSVRRDDGNEDRLFGPAYRVVVAVEVAALAAGLIVINTSTGFTDPGGFAAGLHQHASEATRAWIAFVVGVHFLGLAALWHRRLTGALGLLVGVCGVIGLLLANRGHDATAVGVVAGVIPGALLLASGVQRLRTA